MFENVKEVEKETVTEEKKYLLIREPTASLLSRNVGYSDEMNHSLIIEGEIIKNKESIGQLKDYSFFLLNEV